MPELDQILSDYAPSLSRLVATYVARPADREDLAQDIALALLHALPSFRGESSLRTYVLRVAHNCALKHITKKRARGLLLERGTEDEEGLTDPAPGPEQATSARQAATALAAQLRSLPLSMCQVLSLTLEGLSQREIAEVLGVKENVVSVRLHRARKLLKERLAASPSKASKATKQTTEVVHGR